MTKYKKEILKIINESYSHLNALEVYTHLKERMPKVVLATIYNNLNSLVEEGLIRKVSIEGQIDRFDKITRHDHVVCKRCGKLIDINFDDLSNKLSKCVGSKIIGYDLKVYVLCDDCQKGKK